MAPSQQIKDGSLAQRWREIMGENYWDGLLDPLDLLLRVELIKYGEMSQAVDDAFISDVYSFKYGQCKFQKGNFFDDPLMPKVGYDVTSFIHATSHNKFWFIAPKPVNVPDWKEEYTWIGFVAVSNDETTKKIGRRDVCIAWRGSVTGTEWGADGDRHQRPVSDGGMSSNDPDVKVHSGFLDMYTSKVEGIPSARDEVLKEVKRLINQVYQTEEVSITVTGHSLGAALALLNGYDIMETRAHVRQSDGKAAHVCVMILAEPRLGNTGFKNRADALGLRVLRVVNVRDLVPKVPYFGYDDVGEVRELDDHDSTYLAKNHNESHNLEIYIHLIDGYQGKGVPFKLETGRDIMLINKDTNALDEDYKCSPKWKIDLNKGMVKKDGRWVHT